MPPFFTLRIDALRFDADAYGSRLPPLLFAMPPPAFDAAALSHYFAAFADYYAAAYSF
jgi:hypothetical protein